MMTDTISKFEEFVSACSVLLNGENKEFLALIRKRYNDCREPFRNSVEMAALLDSTRIKMQSEPHILFVHLKYFVNQLKAGHGSVSAPKKRKAQAPLETVTKMSRLDDSASDASDVDGKLRQGLGSTTLSASSLSRTASPSSQLALSPQLKAEPLLILPSIKSKRSVSLGGPQSCPSVVEKDSLPSLELKESCPVVEKDSPPSLELKDSCPVVEKDSPPSLELKESCPVVEKDSRPTLELQESGSAVADEDSRPTLELQESGSAVADEDSPPTMELQESGSAVVDEDSRPTMELQESGSAVADEDSRPTLELQESGSAVADEDSRPTLELQESGSAVVDEDSRPSSELKESCPVVEKDSRLTLELLESGSAVADEDSRPSLELKESCPVIVEKDNHPTMELKESCPVIEKDSRPSLEFKESCPVVEKDSRPTMELKESCSVEKDSRPTMELQESGSAVADEDSRPTMELQESGSAVADEDSRPTMELQESGSAVADEDSCLTMELKESGSAVADEDSQPTLELQESGSAVADEDSRLSLELKESCPVVEKEKKTSLAEHEYCPHVNEKDSPPALELQEMSLTVVNDCRPSLHKLESCPTVVENNSPSSLELKESCPGVVEKENLLLAEQVSSPVVEEDNLPALELKESSPVSVDKDDHPFLELQELCHDVEKDDQLSLAEQESSHVEKDSLPSLELKESCTVVEKDDHPPLELQNSCPVVVQKDDPSFLEEFESCPVGVDKDDRPSLVDKESCPDVNSSCPGPDASDVVPSSSPLTAANNSGISLDVLPPECLLSEERLDTTAESSGGDIVWEKSSLKDTENEDSALMRGNVDPCRASLRVERQPHLDHNVEPVAKKTALRLDISKLKLLKRPESLKRSDADSGTSGGSGELVRVARKPSPSDPLSNCSNPINGVDSIKNHTSLPSMRLNASRIFNNSSSIFHNASKLFAVSSGSAALFDADEAVLTISDDDDVNVPEVKAGGIGDREKTITCRSISKVPSASSTAANSKLKPRVEASAERDAKQTQGRAIQREETEGQATHGEGERSGEPDSKENKHVKRLERLLEKLRDKIEQVREQDLSVEDLEDDDSPYIFEDRLQKKFVKVWNKVCELKGSQTSSGRPIERRVKYQGTRYPEINRKIQKFVNRPDSFPDYHDVRNIVRKVNTRCKLKLSVNQVNDISRESFLDIGETLQKRRQEDFISTFQSKQTLSFSTERDPALFDEELRRKLDANQQLGKSRLEAVIQKYSNLQMCLVDEDKDTDGSEGQGSDDSDKEKKRKRIDPSSKVKVKKAARLDFSDEESGNGSEKEDANMIEIDIAEECQVDAQDSSDAADGPPAPWPATESDGGASSDGDHSDQGAACRTGNPSRAGEEEERDETTASSTSHLAMKEERSEDSLTEKTVHGKAGETLAGSLSGSSPGPGSREKSPPNEGEGGGSGDSPRTSHSPNPNSNPHYASKTTHTSIPNFLLNKQDSCRGERHNSHGSSHWHSRDLPSRTHKHLRLADGGVKKASRSPVKISTQLKVPRSIFRPANGQHLSSKRETIVYPNGPQASTAAAGKAGAGGVTVISSDEETDFSARGTMETVGKRETAVKQEPMFCHLEDGVIVLSEDSN